MIHHTSISTPESTPEVEASPLVITLVEEALESLGKKPLATIILRKRLQSLSDEDLDPISDYIHSIRKNSILNERVREIEKAKKAKDFTPVSAERIVTLNTKLQILIFIKELVDEERSIRSLKRAEGVKNRAIEFETFGHIMLNDVTTLTQGEVQNIMRQPRRAEDSLH